MRKRRNGRAGQKQEDEIGQETKCLDRERVRERTHECEEKRE